MKRKRILSILLLLPFIGMGCTRDVILELPPTPPRLVLNASISPGQDVAAFLSKSWFLLDSVPDSDLPEGTIRVYVNDRYRGTMQPSDTLGDTLSLKGQFRLPGCRVEAGDKVRLEAESPGFDPVQAETEIPAPVDILSVDTVRFRTTEGYFEQVPQMRVYLGFQDEPKRRNFYRLVIERVVEYQKGDSVVVTHSFRPDESFYWEDHFLLSYEDPVFQSGGNNPALDAVDGYTCRGTFTDDLFDGHTYTLKSTLYPVIESYRGDSVTSVVHYDIRLLAISESYYHYLTVIRGFSVSLGEAYLGSLLEPASTYTNVKDGFGVLSGYQVAYKRITMPFGTEPPYWNPWSPPSYPTQPD